jgi:hypothetical protein
MGNGPQSLSRDKTKGIAPEDFAAMFGAPSELGNQIFGHIIMLAFDGLAALAKISRYTDSILSGRVKSEGTSAWPSAPEE